MRASPFERQLIASALLHSGSEIAPGTAVVLMPDLAEFARVFQDAVSPALHERGFVTRASDTAFDSNAWLSDAARWAMGAELLIADVTALNPDVMYTLGLCHGLGRCPLMISQDRELLPFNLEKFRCLRYTSDAGGLWELREGLGRAIRVFAAEASSSREKTPSE